MQWTYSHCKYMRRSRDQVTGTGTPAEMAPKVPPVASDYFIGWILKSDFCMYQHVCILFHSPLCVVATDHNKYGHTILALQCSVKLNSEDGKNGRRWPKIQRGSAFAPRGIQFSPPAATSTSRGVPPLQPVSSPALREIHPSPLVLFVLSHIPWADPQSNPPLCRRPPERS